MLLKIFACVTAGAILLGIVTVTPCAMGRKGSVLGRTYGFDTARVRELFAQGEKLFCRDKQE